MEPLQSSDHFLERDSESEKSALKSTLPSTPVEQQPPRSRIFGLRRPCCSEESSYGSKTKARKLGTKLLHFVILITVFVGFLGPTAYKHLSTLWVGTLTIELVLIFDLDIN